MACINEGRPIYITYSREDVDANGRRYSEVEQRIASVLRNHNIIVYDDVADLVGGDVITEFEKNIGDSESTIIIYSDRYFRSPHCMYEYSQIREGLKSGKKKNILCIKCGTFNLNDKTYIDGLKQYWKDYGKKLIDSEFAGTELKGIEQAAKDNKYYKDHIAGLSSFFGDRVYYSTDNLDNEKLLRAIYKWFNYKPKPPVTERPPEPKKSSFVEKPKPTDDSSSATFFKKNIISLLALIGVIIMLVLMFNKDGNNSVDSSNNGKPTSIVDNPQPTPTDFTSITVDGKEYGKMVFAQGGSFDMGSNDYYDEKPIHSVTVPDFYIGETEVTQGLWKAVMGSNPSKVSNGDNYPVESVSWDDCQTFINKLNDKTGKIFRLPTESEWEYAARGGNNHSSYKYSGSNTLGDVAWSWYGDNSEEKTHPVKTKKSNALGIYDMSGNVWEWCQDAWDGSANYSTSPKDGSANNGGSYRVLRGGSWSGDAGGCRVSNRFGVDPSYRYGNIGLRLALSPSKN